jgi:hypothetical protein
VQVANAANVAAHKYATIPVADEKKVVVNKQFNSPMGLYSKENIQKAVQEQTGMTP